MVGNMKNITKLLAVLALLAIAIVPLMAAEGSDAAITRDGQCTVGGFTDYNSGTLTIKLNNSENTAVKVNVKVFEFGADPKTAEPLSQVTDVEIPSSSEGGTKDVSLSWGYGSEGKKYVDVIVYDSAGNEITNASEHGVEIDVTHSIWKNSITYVVIVLIVLVIIIALVLYLRSTKKTKADTTMADRTFTKMHNEKLAKKSGAAEKKEYKSSGNKTRKSK